MTVLNSFVDTENIEYRLFINADGKHAIRVRDLDAGENYTIVAYPTPEQASTAFDELAKAIQTQGATQ